MFISGGLREETQFNSERRIPGEGQIGHKMALPTADNCYGQKKKNVYTSAKGQRKWKVG